MKKALSILLCVMMVAGFAFAEGNADKGAAKPAVTADSELVNGKFVNPRSITVEIYDRSNDGGSAPEDNYWTDFIKAGMLRDHNVIVEFKPVPRWTEVQVLNNLLAAGDAPDICVTYDYPTIQTYANMGGVLDMNPYLSQYKSQLGDLWNLLGDTNIYYDQDPDTKTVWAIEGIRFHNNRCTTFIREDWLKKLNLAAPKTLADFEAVLRAFKANASKLLGADADKLIPFSTSVDVGWRADTLTASFIPNNVSDDDFYIRGFDDRRMLQPGYKDAIRVLNKWYNEGLIWKDFAIYPYGDKTEDNLIKAGYVGAFIHNWDYPYRDGENGIHGNIQKLVGPEAAFIAVDTFKNDAGLYRKYFSPAVDRKVFFPSTNDEPVASILYVNWISKLENRKYLQIGDPGVHYEIQADGAIKALPVKGEKIINAAQNIDYTLTINGLDLGEPGLTARSLALSYAGVPGRYIEEAYKTQVTDVRISKHYNLGEIKAEEGMGPALSEKRNNMLVQSVVAKPADFDRIFDNGLKDYLGSGGQAIIDERAAKIKAAK